MGDINIDIRIGNQMMNQKFVVIKNIGDTVPVVLGT